MTFKERTGIVSGAALIVFIGYLMDSQTMRIIGYALMPLALIPVKFRKTETTNYREIYGEPTPPPEAEKDDVVEELVVADEEVPEDGLGVFMQENQNANDERKE